MDTESVLTLADAYVSIATSPRWAGLSAHVLPSALLPDTSYDTSHNIAVAVGESKIRGRFLLMMYSMLPPRMRLILALLVVLLLLVLDEAAIGYLRHELATKK